MVRGNWIKPGAVVTDVGIIPVEVSGVFPRLLLMLTLSTSATLDNYSCSWECGSNDHSNQQRQRTGYGLCVRFGVSQEKLMLG